jgi:hypothetical protein
MPVLSFLSSLRALLFADAMTCAAMGALLVSGSGLVAGLTDIPAPLLFYAGLSLLPVAAFMALVALQVPVSGPLAWLVIGGNVLWVAASLLLLVSGWIAPNALGLAFVIAQAVAVAALALLELGALRQPAATFGTT